MRSASLFFALGVRLVPAATLSWLCRPGAADSPRAHSRAPAAAFLHPSYSALRYDPTTRVDLEASICASAGLPEGTRFQLEDEDGDTIVLSNSIPNMTRLTLKVIEEPGKGGGGAAQKKRRRSGGSGSAEGRGSGGAKKLRSHTQAGTQNALLFWRSVASPSPPRPSERGRLLRACACSHVLRVDAVAVKSQISEMGFEQAQVDKCAAAIEGSGEDVTVPSMLRALADAERVAAAARSPMHAAARAASEKPDPKAGGAKGSEDSSGEAVCCICLDGFENNKALFITECGHKYHFGCIRKYCEKGKETTPSCPLCRQNLPTPPGQSKRGGCVPLPPPSISSLLLRSPASPRR